MQTHSRKSANPLRGKGSGLGESYQHHFHGASFYLVPPTEEVTIEEFEQCSMDRLRVLKELDAMRAQGLKGSELENRLDELLRKHLPLHTQEGIRRDVISHFALRLAYCKPNDRKWFTDQEVALLGHRMRQKNLDMAAFLQDNRLEYTPISKEEASQVRGMILEANPFVQGDQDCFKVPFEQAVSLVKNRRVFLEGGWAYVSADQLWTIITGRYRHHLSEALSTAYKAHGQLMAKFDSVAPILNRLASQYYSSDYKLDSSKRTGHISLDQLDMLAKRSFPMCMKSLHSKVRESHHLKHMGRMQYGLFLKGIGLSLEDALAFWRSEFSKSMGVDKFDKNYAYNIRHNYGKEGRRTDYTPYSCIKIIMGDVGPTESHGCPFRHFDKDTMRLSLQKQGVAPAGINQLLELVQGGHFQVACRKHFELTHPGAASNNMVVNHPNQYFDESEKFFNDPIPTATTAAAKSSTATDRQQFPLLS